MNLIITCARHLEPETKEEVSKFLAEYGDEEPEIIITNMSGILTAKTKLDPVEVVNKIQERLLDEPWSVRYCLRMIPIQKVTDTKIEEIDDTISEMAESIPGEDSYRISIEKRDCNMSSQELISAVAKNIKNKVSLENPDKIVLIEILGAKTGISILKKSDIFSLEKTKRSLSD